MRRWDPLNELQLSVLSKIAEGIDLSDHEGAKYRRSAYALRDRGLVTAGRKQGKWQSRITDTDRFYLEHGHHPDRPSGGKASKEREHPAEAERKRARASRSASSDDAAKLIADLNAGGGVLHLESPDMETRARYRRAIDRAKRHSLVPEGKSLKYTGRSAGDLVMCLVDPANGGETEWNKIRTTTGSTHTGTTAILEELRRDPSPLRVSEALRPRTLTVIESLGKVLSRKGYRLIPTKRRNGTTLFVTVNGRQYDLTVVEEREQVGEEALGHTAQETLTQPLPVASPRVRTQMDRSPPTHDLAPRTRRFHGLGRQRTTSSGEPGP